MIYIGKFIYTNNQQLEKETERRNGEFNLIAEAGDKNGAIMKFNERISQARQTSELLEGRCRVYLLSLIELDRLPQHQAVMFNYTSVAGDPVMPFISCSAPDGEIDGCRILNWRNNEPEVDGGHTRPYMEFPE